MRSEFGDSPLTIALTSDQTDAAETLIEAGAKWDVFDGKPLVLAAEIEDPAALERLLRAGPTPIALLRGGAPLCLAVARGFRRAVAVLLEHGADPNTRCPKIQANPPVILIAVANHNSDQIASLVRAGADVNAADDEGRTALELAKRQPQLLELLR